jgi:DNA topoisomerase-1
MKLLIVESPTKAKTITKYLGSDFEIRASVGHVRDLPKSNKNAIDIEKGFVPHYVVSSGKEHVLKDLKQLSKKADEVILATDPDREGEAIAWHLQQACGLDDPKRIVFHEITKDAILDALQHPRSIDNNLRRAQEARRVLDRLFGYDLSGLIWKKLRYGLSAGRVQSPALRILVEREKEIRAFIPEAYWTIDAVFMTQKGDALPFACSVQPKSREETDAILAAAKSAGWIVASIDESKAVRRPRAPFTTSTLQQSASSRFGYAPSVTMRLAQKLYEAGHITYMRTDSTVLSAQAMGEIASLVEGKYGKKYLNAQAYKTRSKNAQEAHEAIRPTSVRKESAGNTQQERRLYELIWKRTVASQMSDAQIVKTRIVAHADKAVPDFYASGARITFDGWFKADPKARSEEVELPLVEKGSPLKLKDIQSQGKETEPPHRYSEAGLIKELEKRDIGRPSTYATIIKTIVDRGYVTKENKSLRPTETGEVVSDFLQDHFAHYISDSFTAEMEDELDQIAEGKRDYVSTLKEFYGPFAKEVQSKNAIPKITNMGEAPKDMQCPVCGGSMIVKLGKSGKFYSCAKFPDCTGARTIEGKALDGPKETGEACPECGKGQLVEREGRFGKFISCNRYPKCRYIKRDAELEAQNNAANSTGVTCPICGKGTMVERKGRYGIFYSCSRYPDCKHIIKSKPTGEICGYIREDGKPCPHLMMEGTKTIPARCSDKTCPNHNPHKLEKAVAAGKKK